MINQEKTKEKFGYYPDDLAQTSSSSVIFRCDKCLQEEELSYAYALKKYKKSIKTTGEELCQKCSHAHRIGKVSVKADKSKPLPLPPEVNLSKTMELYGINAEDLSPWSRQKVCLSCACGKQSETKRCSLNSSKSILETGHYKCTGCWTRERRAGLKLSDETKKKMAKSQQKRRNKNKVTKLPTRPTYAPLQPAANGDTVLPKNNGGSVINFPNKK